MKVNGMLECNDGAITYCPFDVTGLFETIDDLKRAPIIVRDFVSIPLVREYLVRLRESKIIVMLGYSDSVRDGSSFASDAQIANTTVELMKLEEELNANVSANQKISIVFYRGRGDTLPRGYVSAFYFRVTDSFREDR
jgi:phosphoenolpyruvate carboxylase